VVRHGQPWPPNILILDQLVRGMRLAYTSIERRRTGNMKTKLFALLLLAGGSLFAETHWSIGIGLGYAVLL
jgi:hypothetical protein